MKSMAVSDLDQLRWYQNPRNSQTFEQFAARLLRLRPAGIEANIGQALHQELEERGKSGREHEVRSFTRSGIAFSIDDEVDAFLPVVGILHEARVRVPFYTHKGAEVFLSGRADAMDERQVWEYKTMRRRYANWEERFLDSYQWRVYCLVFGRDMARHVVFHMGPACGPGDGDNVIMGVDEIVAYAYPDLQRDVTNRVDEFVEFADTHLPEYWRRYRLTESDRARLAARGISNGSKLI